MSRGLRFEPEAKQELWDSIDYYNEKSSGLGWEFADEVDGVGTRILSDPFRFRRARGDIRRAFLKRFKYWIYFSIEPDWVAIAAVFSCKRDPEELRKRGLL
jgi:toxin ParE1/3/4